MGINDDNITIRDLILAIGITAFLTLAGIALIVWAQK